MANIKSIYELGTNPLFSEATEENLVTFRLTTDNASNSYVHETF